ncbi:hypothetical protein Tco_0951903 [Tanacetum coccineum]|uniref:Integrase, catalytic region, zinc finger, CCHC-type, peptidase aspartic, catalytic n=1 Tax=Tanacetum coccineum TaxID=301880 RepID=A0ABQ5DX99_9ASTR
MFDEYINPPTIVVSLVPTTTEPRAVDIAESPVSTSIDLDAPSTSIPSTQEQEHSPIISQCFEESLKTPHYHDDPLHESLHEDSTSQGSSSNVRPYYTPFEHLGRYTKEHPIVNVIGDPSRSDSIRKQLETDTMWCYFDAFLTLVEPKNFKQAMTEPSWIDAMQDEIHEFKRLQNREPISEDILGATIQRDTGSYYPKRYWELLPKEILGAITQRDTRSYNPKRYYELLPKEILGAITQRCRTGMSYGKMEGASCTQRKFFMVPLVFSIPFVLSWGGSISFDSFLPSVLLLVVIIITIVIVVVILIVVVVVIVEVVIVVVIIGVVVIVGGVSSILKFCWAYAFHRDKASSVRVPVANVTLSSSTHLLRENTDSVRSNQRMRPTAPFVAAWLQCCNNTISNQLQNGSLSSSGTGSLPSGRVDLIGNEDPTDEDGDTGMGDSKGVSVSLRWLKIS